MIYSNIARYFINHFEYIKILIASLQTNINIKLLFPLYNLMRPFGQSIGTSTRLDVGVASPSTPSLYVLYVRHTCLSIGAM